MIIFATQFKYTFKKKNTYIEYNISDYRIHYNTDNT